MAKKLTSTKAKEMLHNPPHGKPLTEKQRKFFGAIANAQNGIEAYMGGLTDKGFNYNGAWGGQFQMGGNVLPGAMGNMYARHGAPSEGKYAKKTLPSAAEGYEVLPEPTDPERKYKLSAVVASAKDILNPLLRSKNPKAYDEWEAGRMAALKKGMPAVEEYYQKNPLQQYLTPSEVKATLSKQRKGLYEDYIGALKDLREYEGISPFQRASLAGDIEKEQPIESLNYGFRFATQPVNISRVVKDRPEESFSYSYDPKTGEYKKLPAMKGGGKMMSYYQAGLDFQPKTISKNGGWLDKYDDDVVKDDMGYWNPDNWGKPVEIGSNVITMDGVYEPLIGVSDTGDVQYMEPGEDYVFDGDSVTEYPIAQTGETLLKDKKVGQLETPIANLNLRPVYPNFKTKIEFVNVPGCPDGVGCSKQATMNAQKITGLPYESYAPADATFRDAVAERTGLQNIFDQEGEQRRNANSNLPNWKYPEPNDFNKWKAGDIVTLDAGVDIFNYSPPPGFTWNDASQSSHNGVIFGFTETGRPIIKHGAAKGKDKGKSWTEVLGSDNRVTDLGHGRYAIKSVWRPKEVSDDGTINTIRNVFDSGKDAAKRKQNTTSNEQFYLKNTSEERLMKDAPVSAEFSGASNRLDTKKKLINLFNDEKLDKDLQYRFGITEEELNNLKPVVYGIFGQESNFNDVDSPAASFKEIIGNMLSGNSRGAAQIKLKSLTPEERNVLGVKKSSDLDSDEAAYKAALLMISNAKKRMDKEVAQGTHPELANVDENFRAGYYYNSPARAVSTAKEWAKKNKPVQWFNPLSWKNAITTRERPDVFGGVNPEYAKKAELRMDEGSYPYKLMENAKDLGVDIDFEKGKDLEEVVIRGTNKPKTTFVKKENGGWLDKYK
jgi:hypothetical protein